uniref:G-protein coupled receptors family 3 profile domain-containing protein n=1 Tax=Eptatretus burgeri TaxID=7764 RepID=A0A8C4Q2I4_EPTBU
MAMIFAIKEVNNDPMLLPNVTLGYMIYEACFNTHKAVKATVSFIGCHSFSIGNATAMARIVSHFNWVFLGALQDDDDYGKQGIAQFVKEVENKGHCLDFIETIPNVDEVDKINLLVSVIVVFSAEIIFSPFVKEIWKRNITGKVWIASETWATFQPYTSQRLSHIFRGTIGFALQHGSIPGFYEFLVNLQPRFQNKLDKYNKDINQIRYETSRQKTKTILNAASVTTRSKCKSGSTFLNVKHELNKNHTMTCTGLEDLRNVETQFTDVSHMRVTFHTYIATYALAHALHDLQQCVPGQGPWDNATCAAITNFQSWQLLYYLKKVTFKVNKGETFFFDKNGDPPAAYEIVNWQKNTEGDLDFKFVGVFDSSYRQEKQLRIVSSEFVWNDGTPKVSVPSSLCSNSCQPGTRKATQIGKPLCCHDCIAYSQECFQCPKYFWPTKHRDACVLMAEEFLPLYDPVTITLLVLSLIGILLVSVVVLMMYTQRELPLMNDEDLKANILLLVALGGCFGSALVFIGKPSDNVCSLRETFPCVMLSLAITCMLAKCTRIGFPLKGIRRALKPVFGTFFVLWVVAVDPRVNYNTTARLGTIIIECTLTSPLWAFCSLIYLIILALLCLGLASKAHNKDSSLNEGKFITYNMLFLLMVVVAFIPAYMSTQGKHTIITETFAIIAVAFAFLGCSFVPKLGKMIHFNSSYAPWKHLLNAINGYLTIFV